jgi:putative DNA primase/helicase
VPRQEIEALWAERYAEVERQAKAETAPQKFERREFSDEFIARSQGASFFGPKPQPKADPEPEDTPDEELEEPRQEEAAESDDEETVEDDLQRINETGHKLWRLESALPFVSHRMSEDVGALLWFMTRDGERNTACDIWVDWLGEKARARWQRGFGPPRKGTAERVYCSAQLSGWRFRIMQSHNRLEEMAKLTEAALVRGDVAIYQKGSRLVRPVRLTVQAAKQRTTTIAVLAQIEAAYFKSALTKTIDFHKWNRKGERERTGASNDLVSAILHRYGEWQFPQVSGVVTSQTLRPDGTVLAREGLDKATGLLVMGPLPKMEPIPEHPTRRDAEEAIAILNNELLSEFPFCDDASRSVALSGAITLNVRPALTCVPLHAATAPAPGTGKSFLFDILAAIVIGDIMPIIAAGWSIEELEKRLDTKMMAGETLFSIDNVSILLGGDTLCQAIERPSVSTRTLGKSEGREHRNVWTMFATGNGLRLRDDVTRRTLLVRMDAEMEQPELRKFNANPLERVLANRGRYIRAALIVVLAYRAAGMPNRLPNIGDPFAEWSDNVRSALVWLGYADPVQTMEAVRENDPRRQARMALFQAIFNAYGSEPQIAAKMIDDAKSGTIKQPRLADRSYSGAADDLKSAIVDYTDNRLDAQYLGTKLRNDNGKIVAGLRLRSYHDEHRKINLWYIERT